MSDERSQRIRKLFERALEIPTDSRAEFLDVACGDDPEIRREVERLLAADASGEVSAAQPSVASTESRGGAGPESTERIGPYRLLRKLGEGGMGIVYEAAQEHPVRRTVALKVVKHGLDGQQVLKRFAAERQALAVMDHPNIARVLDAGSDAGGRPYFVMEYIRGVPVTEYCDRSKLSTRERIELLIRVAEGVQHAHQKGIIHRDLKPTNILVEEVDGKPVPKIIDFGVAKAIDRQLTERTLFTEFGQMVGTPEYMSPEQAEMGNLDVDTRTDVYSLGVVLYELLVGALPLDPVELRREGYDAMRRHIIEDTPAKPSTRLATLGGASADVAKRRRSDPSTLVKLCRGDLDWITMKALEKERTRRYASASELAADLKRHLANEPVTAGPPSAGYRARKFVRRHRVGVAAALLIFTALVVSLAGATYGLVRAVRAEKQARFEADTTGQISQFMLDMFEINDPSEARGRSVTAKEILDRAAERMRSELSDRPALKARLLEAMGKVYRSLGLYQDSLPLLESAVESQSAAFGADDPQTAKTMTTLAGLLIQRGRAEEAIPMLERAIAVEKAKLPEGDLELARAFNNLGNAYRALSRYKEALPPLEEALAIRERALGPDDPDVAKQLVNVGSTRLMLGDIDGARRDLERSRDIRERKLGPDHPDVANSLDALATFARKTGDLARADDLLRRILAIKEANLGVEHPGLVITLTNLGVVERARGDLAASESDLRRAVAIASAKLEPAHRDAVAAGRELEETLRARGEATRIAAH